MRAFTAQQGRYLSFIYIYTKIHGRPPAEADLQVYFGVTPPAIHQMVLTLHAKGLISRQPGAPRSTEVPVRPQDLPLLEFLMSSPDSKS